MPRRIPSFPVSFEISRPTRFSKAQSKMYFANEWEEYQKSLHHDDVASTSAPADAPQPIATPNDTHATVSPVAENTGAIAAPASSPASVSPPPGTVHSQLLGSGRRPLLPPDFSRHARRCCICSHPDRDAIEGDFIRWHSVELIAREYKIATRKSIYRHAHCTGLFAAGDAAFSKAFSKTRNTFPSSPPASSFAPPASTRTSTKTETGSSQRTPISLSLHPPRPSLPWEAIC